LLVFVANELEEERQKRQGRQDPSLSADAIAREIVDAGLKVHRALGPGLLESVYESCHGRELDLRGLRVERQMPLSLEYEGVKLETGFRLDMLVESAVIIEVMAVELLLPLHAAQVLTYLQLSGCKLGSLMNFNTVLFKQGVKRIVAG